MLFKKYVKKATWISVSEGNLPCSVMPHLILLMSTLLNVETVYKTGESHGCQIIVSLWWQWSLPLGPQCEFSDIPPS